MNRSILIVICDFLLVSLLAFSTVDINKSSSEGTPPPNFKMDLSVKTNQVEAGKDLTAVMRVALEDERRNRDVLLGELERTRAAASERERQASDLQSQLKARDEQAQHLQQQENDLQAQLTAAQTNMSALNQQLQAASTETVMSKEKLAAMEAESRKQSEKATALQEQLGQLSKSNEVVQIEKQQLATKLQVAEVEKQSATEQAARLQEDVKVERQEKAQLAEGVKALATKSSQLAEEIRENQPLAANTIFNVFVTNRVEAHFYGVRTGFFGNDTTKRKDTEAVLVTDGTNTLALCHVQDTPLTLWTPGTDWQSLSGILARSIETVPIHSLSFCLADPRLVLMPVSPIEAAQLGGKPYKLAPDPFKFQDAVLVGAKGDYYGDCKFQIDLTTPDYLKLDNNFIKGLFGKFNPSRGDFVFSQNGELLGVMANNTYCLMIQNFKPAATFQFGDDVHQQHTGEALSRLYALVQGLPFKLQ